MGCRICWLLLEWRKDRCGGDAVFWLDWDYDAFNGIICCILPRFITVQDTRKSLITLVVVAPAIEAAYGASREARSDEREHAEG